MSICKYCEEQPSFSGSAPVCCFENGEFSQDGWNCGTMNALRRLLPSEWDGPKTVDAMRVRRDDQSYAAIYIPPNPNEEEDEGEWRGGGFIAMAWYKERGRVHVAVRVDGYHNGKPCAQNLTRKEAESAVENLMIARKVKSLWD